MLKTLLISEDFPTPVWIAVSEPECEMTTIPTPPAARIRKLEFHEVKIQDDLDLVEGKMCEPEAHGEGFFDFRR